MSIDFSDEKEQKIFAQGPVPGGSEVILRLTELIKNKEGKYIHVAQSGLFMLCCKFVVNQGTYTGYNFTQYITLPAKMQSITLTDGQKYSCEIHGAMIKAMCEAAGRSPKLNNITDLEGLVFPCRVRIAKKSWFYEGKEYWKNEIALVLTPNIPELKDKYNIVKATGEIINENGPVTFSPVGSNKYHDNSSAAGQTAQEENKLDEVPF